MGALCCCFHVRDVEHSTSSNGASSDDCLCPKCLFQNFMNKQGNLFARGRLHAISPIDQPASSLNSEQVRQIGIKVKPNSITGDDIAVSKVDQEHNSISSVNAFLVDAENGFANTCPDDDEDVCPTCLEEYTEENPKIIAKCSHHYHLSCIYEWMERSEKCPACRELMQFDESS